jgi:hypothetical protein
MKTQLTPHDWEALSAYLDNQLVSKERSRIEARLREDPDLRQALVELRRTRQILRAVPKLRAPRNFTLTPDMAGVRRGARSTPGFYSALRLASLLATFFFVLVTAGSFLVKSMAPAPVTVMRANVQNAAPALSGKGGGGGEAGPAPMAPPAPTQEASSLLAQSGTETPGIQALQVTPQTEGVITPTPVQVQALAAPRESAVTDQSASGKQPAEKSLATQQVEAHTSQTIWSFLGVVQIILALLAVITGLLAIFLYRGRRTG